ncbi:MAG: NADP-dependent malic enzyme [Candidatus Peregrinibacteria bacterium]|nr:NADP-dependent malic enzyme [Candidatus Peregrinibacteria bacterium]
MNYGEESVAAREKSGGQLFTGLKKDLQTKDDLSVWYTPGIAEPCRRIHADKEKARDLTIRKNSVAVVSDGSAVLGLGNIGPEAALPVMEGKAMLFKRFGDIDAFPIVLDTQDTEEIIKAVQMIAPTFGGINLEDISAPRCFEIEDRLSELLDIPVFHDDQHGTAICVLAALMNSLKIVKKDKAEIRVVFSGAGAAGIAVAKILKYWGVKNIEMVDSKGIIPCRCKKLHSSKMEFCSPREGTMAEALVGADVFIGVSKPNIVSKDMVRSMAKDPIIFAMSNPDSEILPEDAHEAGAKIVATGRSDYPNQINNVLVFPGVFRGLLDAGIRKVTPDMKVAAAEYLAAIVENPTPEKIIPYALEEGVAEAVAKGVMKFK